MVAINRELSKIKCIIVHCSATDLEEFDNIESIDRFHRSRGWVMIGYNFFIDKKGRVSEGRPLTMAGAHCYGHNIDSIGICLSGNKKFTSEQFSAAWLLIKNLREKFKISRREVYPHNYFNIDKTCPNFSMSKIWSYDE